MTNHEIRIKAIELMKQHGLYQQGWRFEFGRRNMTKVRAKCMYREKIIRMAPCLDTDTDARVINTILHEVAHALLPAIHGHDNVWRALAQSIGCSGERCTGIIFEKGAKRCQLQVGQHVKINPVVLRGQYSIYKDKIGCVRKVKTKNADVAFANNPYEYLTVRISQLEIVR